MAVVRALGQARPDQRSRVPRARRRQHDSSGQRDVARSVVSRPRNHFTWAYGTPTLTENEPAGVSSVNAVHQYVPLGVSVYCA